MISIAIPTYEMNGSGKFFIEKSLNFISNQTYREFEVVISDHSYGDDIKKICDNFTDLNINFIKNESDRGSSSSNLNNAIKNCRGEIIKFLMQDEFIFYENSLLDIKNAFDNEEVNWLVTGCVYGSDVNNILGSMSPYYSNDIVANVNNTIGSPSVLSIRNKDVELFNPDLIWVMDCEYYKRLFDKWGEPSIINDPKVFITQHKDQVTNLISREIKIKEQSYLKNKYHI